MALRKQKSINKLVSFKQILRVSYSDKEELKHCQS